MNQDFHLFQKLDLHLILNIYFSDYQNEMMSYYQRQKLSKLHEPAISNDIPYPFYTYFSLSQFFTILVAPNKQFVNLKSLVGFLGQEIIMRYKKVVYNGFKFIILVEVYLKYLFLLLILEYQGLVDK